MDDSSSGGKLTPWKIWLHPVRSWKRLEDLADAVKAAEAARKEASDITLRQSAEMIRAVEENAEKRAELAESLRRAQSRIEELLRENEEQRLKIEEYRDVEQAIADFEKRLGEFEAIRKDYDLRLHTLRLQLDDANRRLNEKGASGISDPGRIEMRPRRKKKEKDPSGWFNPLPDNI